MSKHLTDDDKEQLLSIAQSMNWANIAKVMQALNWKYYQIPGRTPNAGELRDIALGHLSRCIHEARSTGQSGLILSTGGFEYAVLLNTEDEERDTSQPAQVVHLLCKFIVESSESNHDQQDGSHTIRRYV